MNEIRIPADQVEEFTAVIAGLQRENIKFNADLIGNEWVITVTGY